MSSLDSLRHDVALEIYCRLPSFYNVELWECEDAAKPLASLLWGQTHTLRQVLMAIEMSGLENKLDRANPGCVTLIRETLEEAGYPVKKADYEKG